ncbi:MAG TPA: zinc transporter ZntB [Pontiella sp.]
MNNDNGLVFGFVLDGRGGGKKVDFPDIHEWQPSDGTLWVHLDYTEQNAIEWLYAKSGIDDFIVESLVMQETRPRSLLHKNGMLLILRGVNMNPGEDPEDMVAIRLWLDADRIITMRHRRVMAIEDLRKAVETGDGPKSTADFLDELSDGLVTRMGTVISDIDDLVDALEDEILTEQSHQLRQKVSDIRRTVIGMRRYLAPQRDVMARLYSEKAEWLDETTRMRLREISDRVTRYVEDLDAIRDRAIVTQEELNHSLAEQMNKTMYVLSIVAALFLPLGFLTGLLGINIGGMPGVENSWAFTIFCIFLVVIATLQVWLFRRKNWM